MSEKTEYPELRKELSRLVELQSKNFLTNEADNLIKELQLVLGNLSPAMQDAVKENEMEVAREIRRLIFLINDGEHELITADDAIAKYINGKIN